MNDAAARTSGIDLAFGDVAGLSAADGALVCVSAAAGVEAGTERMFREAVRRAMTEAMAIAAGLGQGFEFDLEKRLAASGKLAHKPSILQDLELGRPMEVEALFRAPLELARLAGVETPTLDLTVALATQAARAAGLYGR